MALIAGDNAPAASFGGQSVAGECGRCCISTAYSLDHSTELDRCRVSATKGRKALLVPPPSQDPSKGLGKFNGSHFTMDARRTNAMDRIRQRVLVSSDIMGLGRMRRRGDVVETSGLNLATFSWLIKFFWGTIMKFFLGPYQMQYVASKQ